MGDVISLQWKHINFEDSKLSKVIRKTGNLYSFKLVQPALEVLKNTKMKTAPMKASVFSLVKMKKFLKMNIMPFQKLKEFLVISINHYHTFLKKLI